MLQLLQEDCCKMTATGASVRTHPAKEEITERLLHGESPENVSKWLRNKFSRDKGLWLNKMTLQAYRKNFLELEGDVLAEVKKEYRDKISAERERCTVQAIQSTDSYQIAKGEVVESLALQVTDMRTRFEEIYIKTNERMAVMETQKVSHLNEKVIVEYLRLKKDILKEFFEMER